MADAPACDPVTLAQARVAGLRERLADLRLALSDARAAYLHAHQAAMLRPRLRLDVPVVMGFVLALPTGRRSRRDHRPRIRQSSRRIGGLRLSSSTAWRRDRGVCPPAAVSPVSMTAPRPNRGAGS